MGYSKEVYRKVRQALDRRRELAQQTASSRKVAVYAAYPRLAEIEREMADTGLSAAKAAISSRTDTDAVILALEQKSAALQQERAALLTHEGYAPDYLTVSYTCAACQDTGYIAQSRCQCMELLLRQLAYQRVSDNSGIDDCRFSNFSLDYYPREASGNVSAPRQAMQQVFQFCQDYATRFSSQSESLLLFGNTGLGKTHLSLSVAYEVIQRGFGVYYASCQRLLDKLHAQQFGRMSADDTDYQQLALDCDLLILDDLGAEFSTTFTIASLQSIINTRLSEHRPSIISTNFDVDLLSERYGERLVSRLFCAYRPLPFYGEDIRKLKRYAR